MHAMEFVGVDGVPNIEELGKTEVWCFCTEKFRYLKRVF